MNGVLEGSGALGVVNWAKAGWSLAFVGGMETGRIRRSRRRKCGYR